LADIAYLAHLCENAALSLRTDASATAIGAILEQTVNDKTKVLGYFSKTLTATQRRYSTYDLELFSIYSATNYFEYILLDKPFIILTDNLSLVNSFSKPTDKHTSKQVRQLAYLSHFECKLQHLPGAPNQVADCLSRLMPTVNNIFQDHDMPLSLD